jgi:hypothetical protein
MAVGGVEERDLVAELQDCGDSGSGTVQGDASRPWEQQRASSPVAGNGGGTTTRAEWNRAGLRVEQDAVVRAGEPNTKLRADRLVEQENLGNAVAEAGNGGKTNRYGQRGGCKNEDREFGP